jgi:hypothetical protein
MKKYLTVGIVRGTKKEVIAVSSNKARPAHREFQRNLRRTGTSHQFEELLVFQCVRKIRLKNGKPVAAEPPKEKKTFVSVAASALSRIRDAMSPAVKPGVPTPPEQATLPPTPPAAEASADPTSGPIDAMSPPEQPSSPPAQEPTPAAPSKAFARPNPATQKPKPGQAKNANNPNHR